MEMQHWVQMNVNVIAVLVAWEAGASGNPASSSRLVTCLACLVQTERL